MIAFAKYFLFFVLLVACWSSLYFALPILLKKIFFAIKTKVRQRRLRTAIESIKIEPHADRDAFAFAFAVSDIASEDIPVAVNMHPLTRERFSSRGRKWICHQTIILRKDEHVLLSTQAKWRRVIRDHMISESRH